MFVFVQETLISSESTIKSLSRRWPGRSFRSPASGRQGGVVTLISSRCSDEMISWKKDSHGRIVSLLVRSNDVDVNLVNIYAPERLSLILFTIFLFHLLRSSSEEILIATIIP